MLDLNSAALMLSFASLNQHESNIPSTNKKNDVQSYQEDAVVVVPRIGSHAGIGCSCSRIDNSTTRQMAKVENDETER
jgi:hypothetical protein